MNENYYVTVDSGVLINPLDDSDLIPKLTFGIKKMSLQSALLAAEEGTIIAKPFTFYAEALDYLKEVRGKCYGRIKNEVFQTIFDDMEKEAEFFIEKYGKIWEI